MRQGQKITISQQQRLALNSSLHASIRLLRSDTAGLTRYLEEQAAENPHLRLTAPEPPAIGDWLPRWAGVLATGHGPGQNAAEPAAASPSLMAHITAAVQAMALPRSAQTIALALIEALEPSGWLGRSLAQIGEDLGLPVNEIEPVLRRLQRIEPAGLFARNLAECLALQAADQGKLDAEMAVILQHLDLLAAGDTARLARLCGCDEAGVLARFRTIRRMNPKPGADFSHPNPALLREPDLLARRVSEGRWEIALNRSALPRVEVRQDETTRETPGDNTGHAAAKALVYMVKARNDTLLRVGREIAVRQMAALIGGPGALRPMTMAEVAAAVGLNLSTVSRVVAGASMDSPTGLWLLRAMFSGARGGGKGKDTLPEDASGDPLPTVAAAALRHRLGQIVASEPAAAPYSDLALAARLAQETGVTLARRTVAKYRETQGIPPAHRRKQRHPR